MSPDPATGHDFNTYGVCKRCGCGRSAASRPCGSEAPAGSREVGGRVGPRERAKGEERQDPTGTLPKRSIFLGSLVGYAIASAMGVILIIWLITGARTFEATAALQVLACAGALGASMGYEITVRRGRARGARSPYDGWSKFIGSGMALGIAMIVIAGSFLLSVLILLVHNAIAAKGG